MKGTLLFVLVFMSFAFSYDYNSYFNLSNVACHAEIQSYNDSNMKLIKINCDDGSYFEAQLQLLAGFIFYILYIIT